MFHPLITPLTTYMYTTDIQNNGTVSATDAERLPPGGFSLRHGFPSWFGRGGRSRQTSGQHQQQPAGIRTPPRSTPRMTSATSTPQSKSAMSPPDGSTGSVGAPSFMQTGKEEISTYGVLRYIRSTFDDEDVLDALPLEAAGNPGAWHAWRTHQRAAGKVYPDETTEVKPVEVAEDEVEKDAAGAETDAVPLVPPKTPVAGNAARKPGEWNWDGVWEERVKKGIATSLSESVLFGNAGSGGDVVSDAFCASAGRAVCSHTRIPLTLLADTLLEHGR